MKFRDIPPIFVEAIRTFTPILFILAASTAFSRVLTLDAGAAGGQQLYPGAFQQPGHDPACHQPVPAYRGNGHGYNPGDPDSTPILLPIVTAINMDPVQFGMIMVVNLAIGFVTPPIGGQPLCRQLPTDVPIMAIAKKAMPMIGLFLVALLLITFIPALSLGLL